MKTIKLTDKEFKMISTVLLALEDQIDKEIVTGLVPEDATDEESDQIIDDARDAFSKIY